MRPSAAVLVLVSSALVSAASCGGSDNPAQSAAPATVREMTLGQCSSATDLDVASSLRIPLVHRTFTGPLGCRWEDASTADGVAVETWWYRGAPIADARKAAAAAGRTTSDVSIGGLAGFTAQAERGGDCSVDVGRGLDFFSWNVTTGQPGAFACAVGRQLAQLSATRMNQ